jgi:hypothetical protein
MSAILSGWGAVTASAVVLLVLAVTACIAAMRGPLSALATAALSFPAMWLLAKHVFGDASVYFPDGTFSEGADGKDQIIIVSVLCTILGGVILAAGAVWLLRRLDGLVNSRGAGRQ